MDLLKHAQAKVDLIARTLTLCSDNGIVATLEGTCKWSNLLSAEVLACMSSFESYGFDNVFQCSVKQAKKLVKDPKVQVFAAIVQSKSQQLALDADELAAAHEFATANFKDCDEFANNVIHLLGLGEAACCLVAYCA